MPPDSATSTTTSRRRIPEARKGMGYRRGRAHISRAEAQNKAWLPWRSKGCNHGDRPHVVEPDGTIREIGDRAEKPKPAAIRTRQLRRFAKGGQS